MGRNKIYFLIIGMIGLLFMLMSCECKHNYHLINTIDPTCEDAGKEILQCDKCGEKKEKELNAIGHNYKTEVVSPASCEQGEKKHEVCLRCGKTANEQVSNKPLGHNYIYDHHTNPTYNTDGTIYTKCTRCSDTNEIKKSYGEFVTALFPDSMVSFDSSKGGKGMYVYKTSLDNNLEIEIDYTSDGSSVVIGGGYLVKKNSSAQYYFDLGISIGQGALVSMGYVTHYLYYGGSWIPLSNNGYYLSKGQFVSSSNQGDKDEAAVLQQMNDSLLEMMDRLISESRPTKLIN